MAQAVFAGPCKGSHVGIAVHNLLHVVVLPGIRQTDTSHEDEVQRMAVVLAEQVGEVDEDVGVSGDKVPLVVFVHALETAFGLNARHVKTCSDNRRKVMTYRNGTDGHEQLVNLGIGCCPLQASLNFNEAVGLEFTAIGTTVLCHHGIGHEQRKCCKE